MQLTDKSPRFYLTKVYPNVRLNLYQSALAWLIESQSVLPVYALEQPQLPLVFNRKNTLFRLFMNDTGMLSSMLGGQIQKEILHHDPDVRLEFLIQNVVATQLVFNDFPLYYYNSKKYARLISCWRAALRLI